MTNRWSIHPSLQSIEKYLSQQDPLVEHPWISVPSLSSSNICLKRKSFGLIGKKTRSKKSRGLKMSGHRKSSGIFICRLWKIPSYFESIPKVSKLPQLEIPQRMLSHLAGCLSIKFQKRRGRETDLGRWSSSSLSGLVFFHINALSFSSLLTIWGLDCSARFTPVNMYSFS